MISDNDLYSLAIFLGSISMLLIILYHFLEVNSKDEKSNPVPGEKVGVSVKGQEKGKGVVKS